MDKVLELPPDELFQGGYPGHTQPGFICVPDDPILHNQYGIRGEVGQCPVLLFTLGEVAIEEIIWLLLPDFDDCTVKEIIRNKPEDVAKQAEDVCETCIFREGKLSGYRQEDGYDEIV